MAVVKLSAIAAAGGAPASTDQIVGVTGGATDNLFTLAQIATSIGLSVTAGKTLTASNSLTLAGTDGKTLTVSNSLTLAGTDASTLNIGTGGTLGTAAYQNTGTSGANIPFLNGANTWSAAQTFNNSNILLLGSSTGATTLTSANAGASNFTATLPAATDTIAELTQIQTLTNKTIAFASNTLTGVAPLASPTFTGTVTMPDAATWTTSGISQINLGGTDTVLSRFGAGTAGLSRTTSSTILQVYSTTDSITAPTNYSRVIIDAGTTAATFKFGSEHGGSGTALTKAIWQIDGTTKLDYGVAAAATWTSAAPLTINTGGNGNKLVLIGSTVTANFGTDTNANVGLSIGTQSNHPITVVTNNATRFAFGAVGDFKLVSTGTMGFFSGDYTTAMDTALSRLGAASAALGNGTANDFTGSLKLTTLNAVGAVSAFSGTAIPAGGTAGAGHLVSSTSNFGVFFGSGAPTLSAAKGSLYLRSDGSTTNDRAYINTNGTTTWTALTTAA